MRTMAIKSFLFLTFAITYSLADADGSFEKSVDYFFGRIPCGEIPPVKCLLVFFGVKKYFPFCRRHQQGFC